MKNHGLVLAIFATLFLWRGMAFSQDHKVIANQADLNQESGFAPQVAIPVTLTIKDAPSADGDRVWLSDVASCAGPHEICDEIYGIDIGKSPGVGKSLQYSLSNIRALVTTEWPNTNLEVVGPNTFKITPTTYELSNRDLEVALQSVIDKLSENMPSFRARVEAAHVSRRLRVAGANNLIKFPDLASIVGDDLRSFVGALAGNRRQRLEIHFGQSEDIQLTTSVSFSITAEILGYVAIADTSAGHQLNPKQFQISWIPISRDQEVPLKDLAKVSWFTFKRGIRRGDKLLQSNLVAPIAIRRGEIVSFRLAESNLEITSRAKATKDAGFGESLDVVLIGTQKRVSAKAIGPGQVLGL